MNEDKYNGEGERSLLESVELQNIHLGVSSYPEWYFNEQSKFSGNSVI